MVNVFWKGKVYEHFTKKRLQIKCIISPLTSIFELFMGHNRFAHGLLNIKKLEVMVEMLHGVDRKAHGNCGKCSSLEEL